MYYPGVPFSTLMGYKLWLFKASGYMANNNVLRSDYDELLRELHSTAQYTVTGNRKEAQAAGIRMKYTLKRANRHLASIKSVEKDRAGYYGYAIK